MTGMLLALTVALLGLADSRIAENRVAEQIAALDRRCVELRGQDGHEDIPKIYLQLGDIRAAEGQVEMACENYSRCAYQTQQLQRAPELADECFDRYERCSSEPGLWSRHRPIYHITHATYLRARDEPYLALEELRAAEEAADPDGDVKYQVLAAQGVLLRRLHLTTRMEAWGEQLPRLAAWDERLATPIPLAPPSRSCEDHVSDTRLARRHMMTSVNNIAFNCIVEQLLGFAECEQDLVVALTKVRAAQVVDRQPRAARLNTDINLAWAVHLRADDAAAAELVRAVPAESKDAEVTFWIRGLRARLVAAGVLAGDWRHELRRMDLAAEQHATFETRWLASLWRGEVMLALGDLSHAEAAFLAAEEVLDAAQLSLGFGASVQSHLAYYERSLAHLADLLHAQGRPGALLTRARQAVQRPGQLLLRIAGPATVAAVGGHEEMTPARRLHELGARAEPRMSPAWDRPLRARPGELVLGLVAGTQRWIAVAYDVHGAHSFELEIPARQALHELDRETLAKALLEPLAPWLARNEVIRPLLPGRAHQFALGMLPWRGAPLFLDRRLTHVIDSLGVAAPAYERDATVVGILLDDSEVQGAPESLGRRHEEELAVGLDLLPGNRWELTALIGHREVHRASILQALAQARMFVFYGREQWQGPRAQSSMGSWDVGLRVGNAAPIGVVDIITLPRVPELALLLACHSAGPDAEVPGILDGTASVLALRGSRWVVGVTGQLDECVARHLLPVLMSRLEARSVTPVDQLVHEAILDTLTQGIMCADIDPVAEFGRLFVIEHTSLL